MVDVYAKLWALLDRRERRRCGLLLAMIIVTGFVNMAGVASVLPFLAVVADPDIISRDPRLAALYDLLAFEDTQRFLVVLAMGTFLALVVSQAVKAATTYALIRFSKMRNFTLSRRLLEGYLHQPYAWFLQQHSADLGKTVLSEVTEVVNRALVPALQFIAQAAVIIGLVALLIIVDPLVTAAGALFVGGANLLVFSRARRYLTRIGRERMRANRERYEIAQEAMVGIKEVKLLGLERSYLEHFTGPARRFSRAQAAAALVGQMPRYLLEAIGFGSMLILILVLLMRDDGSLRTVLPLLGLYALAGVRLFPAIQQLYSAGTQLRFAGPALDALHADLAMTRAQPRPASDERSRLVPRRRIALADVAYGFPGSPRRAVAGLDIAIDVNTTVGLVGPTGAGKTTAVDLILGLLEPQSGRLMVDDTPIDAANRRSWQRALGYVPQHIFLTDDSIAANIALGVPAAEIDMAAVEKAARIAELDRFVQAELPHGYATTVGERGIRLSGGQRQRIGIARALYHDPDVLVLDEATSALDNRTERAVMDAVRNLGHAKTIIMVAHRLSTVRACDRIFMLEEGRCIAAGRYEELLDLSASFRNLARLG